MNNEIAVIIPTYNSEKTIQRCIKSVRDQKLDGYAMKIIVVDDQSTDKTKEIVQNMKYVVWADNPEHTGGPNAGRNTGIELANDAKYIAFIDHDDEWVQDKLAAQIRYMDEYNQDICYTGYRIVSKGRFKDYVNGNNNVVQWEKNVLFRIFLRRDMDRFILPYMSSFVLRNKNIPKFDHPIFDFGWSLKLLENKEVLYIDVPYLIRHEEGDNYSYDEGYKEGAVDYIHKTLKGYKNKYAKAGKRYFNFQYYLKALLEEDKKKARKFLWRTFF